MMAWSDKYIGQPWRDGGRHDAPGLEGGVDCWGLLRWVYAAELNVLLPSWREAYATADDGALAAGLIDAHRQDWSLVAEQRPFDAVLMRKGPHACHVGIVASSWSGGCAFLHVDSDSPAALARSDDPRWRRRIIAYYRYLRLPAR